jgi:hypothetical protein
MMQYPLQSMIESDVNIHRQWGDNEYADHIGVLNCEDFCYVFLVVDHEKWKYLHMVVARYLLHSFSGIQVWWKSTTRKVMVGLDLQSDITWCNVVPKLLQNFSSWLDLQYNSAPKLLHNFSSCWISNTTLYQNCYVIRVHGWISIPKLLHNCSSWLDLQYKHCTEIVTWLQIAVGSHIQSGSKIRT